MVGRDFYLGGAGGAVVGGLQGYCLRSFVDTKYRIEALGDFGQPSVLMGLGGGFTALGLGLAGLLGKGPLRGETATGAATFYGVTALATAIWSLLFPVKKGGQTAAAAKPPIRVVKTAKTTGAKPAAAKPQVRVSKVGATGATKPAVVSKTTAAGATRREEAQFM